MALQAAMLKLHGVVVVVLRLCVQHESTHIFFTHYLATACHKHMLDKSIMICWCPQHLWHLS